MTAMKDRVAKGMAALDKRKPGWDVKIDLERLELSSDCGCVIGQLYGSYSENVHKVLGVPRSRAFLVAPEETGMLGAILRPEVTDKAEAYGFTLSEEAGTFVGLTRAWKSAIKRRQRT